MAAGYWWAWDRTAKPETWSFCTAKGLAASRRDAKLTGCPEYWHSHEQADREPKPASLDYSSHKPYSAPSKSTGSAAIGAVSSERNLYSFFAAPRPGHCACDIPKHQCKYHG